MSYKMFFSWPLCVSCEAGISLSTKERCLNWLLALPSAGAFTLMSPRNLASNILLACTRHKHYELQEGCFVKTVSTVHFLPHLCLPQHIGQDLFICQAEQVFALDDWTNIHKISEAKSNVSPT